MPKPEVPTGGITFDTRPPRINADALGKQLADLFDDGLLDAIHDAIDQGQWDEAEGQLWILAERIGKARLKATTLASTIHRRVRLPLLEQEGNANG